MSSSDSYGRQLDSTGAGIPSLPKIHIVDRSERSDADVNYTFIGIGIERDGVDMVSNYGNMSSAIGPYASKERPLQDVDCIQDGPVTVNIYNTNTGDRKQVSI